MTCLINPVQQTLCSGIPNPFLISDAIDKCKDLLYEACWSRNPTEIMREEAMDCIQKSFVSDFTTDLAIKNSGYLEKISNATTECVNHIFNNDFFYASPCYRFSELVKEFYNNIESDLELVNTVEKIRENILSFISQITCMAGRVSDCPPANLIQEKLESICPRFKRSITSVITKLVIDYFLVSVGSTSLITALRMSTSLVTPTRRDVLINISLGLMSGCAFLVYRDIA